MIQHFQTVKTGVYCERGRVHSYFGYSVKICEHVKKKDLKRCDVRAANASNERFHTLTFTAYNVGRMPSTPM